MAIAEAPAAEVQQPTVSDGPRMPKHTRWVALPEPYDGMQIQVWTNYPHGIGNALRGLKGTDAFKDALAACVLAHDGWLDADGQPLPPADTPDFWWGDGVSDELVGVVLAVLAEVPTRFPKELRTNGTR
jgi:hypothetical protein